MQEPLRIGIDFDGVIVDHRPHKLRLAGALGFALEPWQANSNVMRDYLSEDAYRSVQKPLYDELTLQAPAVSGALETLARLPGELYVISARRPETASSARAWMARKGLHDIVPRERVIFCAGGSDKREYCERLSLSIFLDDKISYLGHLPEDMTRVLFDEDGIAAHVQVPPELQVVASWHAFAVLTESIAAGAA